ncbi:hypothetical protein IWX50DRAFT_615780 [Phyllosticta citricarpa]
MDVCKWLEETVGPGPPATLTLPPGRDAREKPVQQNDRTSSHQTRRCNHLFSDSSLLQVARLDNVQGLSAHKPDHVGRPPRQSLEEDRPTTVPSDASDPQQHEGPDLYARRPRRKTRPEIYEPKLGGDREMAKQTRQKEKEGQGKKGSKPKPRRKAAKDRQSHHAHAFQATNVTKERLTMKPNQSIGLFKKGRASTPVKGRGWHRSKSASLRQRCPSRTSTRFESAKPTIELPDKPHLGFGSRVVDPVASDPTYYTPWSESVRDASHQEYKPSDAPLPPMQSSLRPHKQSTKARGSVGGHPGRDTGASGEGERSQQASQVAMRSTSGRSHNSRGIPHNVEHRERDSTPKGIAERLVPSTSNQSTVPEHEPRLGKGSPRFNGQLDESVLTAKSEEEKVDGAVNTAGKQHEPSRRPVFDRDVPDCRVEKSKMRTDYAMFLDADSNENDHAKAKVSTSPRSSSPLGLLLRNCENACNDSCLDRDSPLEAGPVSKSLAVVRDGLACQLDEVYRPSMPQRWASGAVRGRPSFYERQWSGNGVEEVPCENLEDDVDMGNHANLIENAYADIEFGEIRGWTDDGLDMPGVRNEAYDGGFEGSPGPTADEVVASTRAAIGGQGEWTWRRHKLY